MISLLGQGLVLVALLACATGAPIGFVAGRVRSAKGLQWTRRLVLVFAASMLLANLTMEYALITMTNTPIQIQATAGVRIARRPIVPLFPIFMRVRYRSWLRVDLTAGVPIGSMLEG